MRDQARTVIIANLFDVPIPQCRFTHKQAILATELHATDDQTYFGSWERYTRFHVLLNCQPNILPSNEN